MAKHAFASPEASSIRVAQPSGTFRLVVGSEYSASRKAANTANAQIRKDQETLIKKKSHLGGTSSRKR
jgi:hypothetical protein